MSRRSVVDAAKMSVLIHGPSNILEFGGEILSDDPEVLAEAIKQAERVYAFLGFVPPGHDE